MKLRYSIFHSLAFRLFVSLLVILLIIFTINTYYSISKQEQQIMNLIEISAIRNSDIIKRSTRYGMLLNRREDVHQIIQTVGDEPGVEGIRIYNKRGEIIFSTKDEEIFSSADMQSESCSPCHAVSKPRSDLTNKERIRIFKNEKGNRVLGLINPIRNEEACSSAECHVHPKSIEILGVLDVQMSLANADKEIALSKSNQLFSSIVITLLISIFSGLFIWILLHLRIKELIKATNEISSGNLEYSMDISSNDEFGLLTNNFNMMSENLNKAYSEIKSWNEKLNEKVTEKTEELKSIYGNMVQLEKIASLGKLSATVAHELNNPLEGILTYSKLITKKLITGGEADKYSTLISYLQLIARESDRCGKIVKNLLLFSHTSENKIEANSLNAILDHCLLLIRHHLTINNIQLEKIIPEEEIIIHCDKDHIQQLLLAIMINAVESMNEGGKLKIVLSVYEDDVEIIIADSGCGIPPEVINKIYEPFFTTKKEGKGTGLGLSVAYGIVKQHNGTININSIVNEGTTVKISLPLSQFEIKNREELNHG